MVSLIRSTYMTYIAVTINSPNRKKRTSELQMLIGLMRLQFMGYGETPGMLVNVLDDLTSPLVIANAMPSLRCSVHSYLIVLFNIVLRKLMSGDFIFFNIF